MRWIEDLVEASSLRSDVPARALELQALMHLPRIADADGKVSPTEAKAEIERLATEIPPSREWHVGPKARSIGDLAFSFVDEQIAREICQRFHYLRSHRPVGAYYGAFGHLRGRWPLAIAVTAHIDVARLRELSSGEATQQDAARVVARVFAFPDSPRNTISRLLSFVATQESKCRGARQMLTYVNPNLGFTGASYLASGWKIAGDEPGTRYRYVDERYMTNRELQRLFGTAQSQELARLLGHRFQESKMLLAPLLIFGRALRANKQQVARTTNP